MKGKIVFTSGGNRDSHLWRLDLETGELAQLTQGDAWNDQARWAPNGEQIVFVSNRTGAPEIWLMDSDGANQRPLTTDRRAHAAPSWAPDGRSILCSANYANSGEVDVWSIALATGDPTLVFTVSGSEAQPSYSPDGKKIVYSAMREGHQDIWEYNLETHLQKPLTNHPGWDHSPCYSPDGRFIAFVSTRGGGTEAPKNDGDIWIMHADGTVPRRLTTNRGADAHVRWSPDGGCLMYCAASGIGKPERIRIIDLQKLRLAAFEGEPPENDDDVDLFGSGLQGLDKGFFGSERHPDWYMA